MAEAQNPFEQAQAQFDHGAELLGLPDEVRTMLRWPLREFRFQIPVRMDDGRTEGFIGFRVQHSLTSGPSKGGLRYHPSVDLGEVGVAAADVSDEMQEAACRALLPPGASVRVISDSGGHQSGFSAARDGYQALLAAVAAGEVTAIVVYDLSRLARNARLMFNLNHELERHQVPLLVANLPGAKFDGATGRYLFGQLCLAAQLQRDLDSERMTGM